MGKIWKTIIIITLIMALIGGAFIAVAFITGADYARIQNLFNSTYNVSSFKEYYTGIVQNVLGIQPLV